MTIPSSLHLTTLQPYGRKKPSEGAVFGPWGKSPGHQDAQHMAEGRRETRGGGQAPACSWAPVCLQRGWPKVPATATGPPGGGRQGAEMVRQRSKGLLMPRATGLVPRLHGEQGAMLLSAVLSFPRPGHARRPWGHTDGSAALCPGAEDWAVGSHFNPLCSAVSLSWLCEGPFTKQSS